MDRACTFRALLLFVIGFGIPSVYVLSAMAYRLYYDFEAVVYKEEGVTNVFTSISRVTATPPWSVGWVIATVVHLICTVLTNDDFAYFWHVREKLLPQEQREVYRSAVEYARQLHWLRAVALFLISVVTVQYSLKTHFMLVTTYFVADVLYLRTVDDLEADLLACCKDSMVARMYLHHRSSNNVMKVMTICILLNMVFLFFGTFSYGRAQILVKSTCSFPHLSGKPTWTVPKADARYKCRARNPAHLADPRWCRQPSRGQVHLQLSKVVLTAFNSTRNCIVSLTVQLLIRKLQLRCIVQRRAGA
ncbi:hypothetical protein HPB50_011328 [Hyalomma asiaticum]|uniref:Uncharacterized protein n=1 Tax=Hyalomma asiaticum TaxID=266040 RepID=A0ACB7RKF0_HYAAI|nr:hypothetical protein HPB50_011328 [Hyalomma asiaticum]